MIGIFIKTAVINYLKQLKLFINNEKLMNLEDLGMLLLLAWISVTSIAVVLFSIFA